MEPQEFKGNFLLISEGRGVDSGRTGRDSKLPSARRAENTLSPSAILHADAERSASAVRLQDSKVF